MGGSNDPLLGSFDPPIGEAPKRRHFDKKEKKTHIINEIDQRTSRLFVFVVSFNIRTWKAPENGHTRTV